MSLPGCPQCGQALTDDTTRDHCPPSAHRSCWWLVHACGALIDGRYTHRFIPYAPRHKEKP